jgi:hypothetical protein
MKLGLVVPCVSSDGHRSMETAMTQKWQTSELDACFIPYNVMVLAHSMRLSHGIWLLWLLPYSYLLTSNEWVDLSLYVLVTLRWTH